MGTVSATTRRGSISAVALAVVVVALPARAADEQIPQAPLKETLRFQRVLVPADKPDEWPRDKSQGYLPMPADEFERRVHQLAEQAAGAPKVPPARLVKAEYSAELIDDDLAAGTATWHFEHHG
jgi:hypothetical protein